MWTTDIPLTKPRAVNNCSMIGVKATISTTVEVKITTSLKIDRTTIINAVDSKEAPVSQTISILETMVIISIKQLMQRIIASQTLNFNQKEAGHKAAIIIIKRASIIKSKTQEAVRNNSITITSMLQDFISLMTSWRPR